MQLETVNINIDDSALVKLCKQGDNGAMERLILKYQNRIYNVILKICANTDDAAELTQDTFVKAIENINGFQEKSQFYTWLFRIAVNLTLNYCKRNVKLGLRSLDVPVNDASDVRGALKEILCDDASPDPALAAQNKELCQIVLKGLMKLEDAHRAVIVLRDIEGMKYSDIANVLEIELGTVKSRLSRARDTLREILEACI